jgi:predicted nucleotidyltransferase
VVTPASALEQLRREARDGTLGGFCRNHGIKLLVAFGSAVDPDWPAPPQDLDLAVVLRDPRTLLQVLDAFVARLGLEQIDFMDLGRANDVARFNALARGELLFEATHGAFAEAEIAAVVRYADTQWLRDLELQALAR